MPSPKVSRLKYWPSKKLQEIVDNRGRSSNGGDYEEVLPEIEKVLWARKDRFTNDAYSRLSQELSDLISWCDLLTYDEMKSIYSRLPDSKLSLFTSCLEMFKDIITNSKDYDLPCNRTQTLFYLVSSYLD